jgi:hypothetical protein
MVPQCAVAKICKVGLGFIEPLMDFDVVVYDTAPLLH